MHMTLTACKQRVYSKLVFKTYKKALCNWLRKLSACFDDKLKAELLKICMHARTICNRLRSVNLCLEQTAAMPGQCHFQDAWLDHPQYKNRTVVQSRFLSDNRLICFGSRVPDTTADNGTSQQILGSYSPIWYTLKYW